MSEVSSGDQTTYTNSSSTWTDPVLNFEPLDELATADISVTPSYPMKTLTVTNTSADWGDVSENLLFRLEQSDGTIIAWGVTREDATATKFYPDVKSDGDFGYATNKGITVVANDIIRIYNNRHLWAMISRVTSAGRQLKRWNRAYNGEGNRPAPVVVMGADQQQFIDTGTNLATYSFDASDTYDWFKGTAGISAYAWTLPSGASVTGGALDADNIAFTIAAGVYRIQMTATAFNGQQGIGVRTIYANDSGSNAPAGRDYAIQSVGADSTDMSGWEGQFTVLGDLTSVVYPGMKCHWFVPVYYDGSRLTDNDAFNDVFIGYLISNAVATNSDGVKSTTLTFHSPLKVCRLLPSATQFVEEVASPQIWTEVIKGLSDPAFAAFYVLAYHTTVIESHDFIFEAAIRTLRRRVFGFPSDTINAHLQLLGLLMSGDVGCRDNGTITLTQKPNLQNTAARDARDDKYTWTENNLRAALTIPIRMRPNIAYMTMYGISYDGNINNPSNKFGGKAPGRAQAQGITKTNLPDITLTTAGGAAELYGIIGHWFAYLNNPLDNLTIPIHAMLDILTPADADWHTLDVSESNYLPVSMDTFGVRWLSTMRMRPTRITRTWAKSDEGGGWWKTINAQCRIESSGRPGVFHPTYAGQLAPYINPLTGWIDDLSITMPDINIDFSIDFPTVDDWNVGWAHNNEGLSGVSNDWNGFKPTYSSANKNLSGDVITQCLDGDTVGAGLMVVWDESALTLTIYDNPDMSADPLNWTAALGLDMTGQGFHGAAHIVSNASLSMLAIQTETRSLIYRRPAAGAWDAGVTAGDSASADVIGAEKQFGIVISGADQWVSGRENTNNGYRIYKATTVAGAFSAVANTPGDNANSLSPFPMIARSGTDILATFGSLDATAVGESIPTNQIDDGGRVASIPDRDDPSTSASATRNAPGYESSVLDTAQWTEDVDWWAQGSHNADGIPAKYGRADIIWDTESDQQISFEVSSFDWTIQTSQVYSASEVTVPLFAELRFLDESKNVLWSGGVESFNDTDGVVSSTGVWDGTLTQTTRLNTFTSIPTTPIAGCRFFEIMVYSQGLETFDVVAGSTGYSAGFLIAGLSNNQAGNTVEVDSKGQSGSLIYSIDDATETWTDITSISSDGQTQTPQRWNALDIFGSTIWAIATDENGQRWLVKSTNGGTDWTEGVATKYEWLRLMGTTDKATLGGEALLALTNDNFKTFHDRLGGWARIGSVGFIEDFTSEGL